MYLFKYKSDDSLVLLSCNLVDDLGIEWVDGFVVVDTSIMNFYSSVLILLDNDLLRMRV